MNRNNIEINILVRGRKITEYAHNGNVFVEGRSGSDFEIEVVNRNPFRTEAIISVDGLSVIDGKSASANSSGYLIDANATLRIPGWKVDGSTAAKFVFAGKEGSYTAQSTGSATNTGVVGVMAFREKPIVVNNFSYTGVSQPLPNAFRSMSSSGIIPQTSVNMFSVGSLSTGSPTILNTATSTIGATAQTSFSVSNTASSLIEPQQQQLGTGFGEATRFETSTVEFTRGDLHVVSVLYYDNIRGLKARGVPMERIRPKTYQVTPQAFPGENCTPPAGWRG